MFVNADLGLIFPCAAMECDALVAAGVVGLLCSVAVVFSKCCASKVVLSVIRLIHIDVVDGALRKHSVQLHPCNPVRKQSAASISDIYISV